MRHPQHFKKAGGRRVIGLCVAAALTFAAVGGSLAWYSQGSSLANMFRLGTADPDISEGFDPASGVKQNVAVEIPENGTNVASYVRAQVDIYWKDADGNRLWEEPVAKAAAGDAAVNYDYEITWASAGSAGTANGWIEGPDGLYYWTSPVEPGGKTDALIQSCIEHRHYDDGRQLVVAISTQAIQAKPARAFDESWGVHCGLTVGEDGVLKNREVTQ